MPRSTPRRSSAPKAKLAMREPDEDDFLESDSSSDDDDDDEEPPLDQGSLPPSTKRSSSAARGGARGNKGALRGILDLPLDVFTGICEHLDLETLFHLSRLNKRFFKFLRGTSALPYLWEWAREESGLPELSAPCFSTVELANLLFSKCCQNCAKTTPKADFLLRVRLCKACSKDLIWDDRNFDIDHDEHARVDLCPAGVREGSGRMRNHVEYLFADINFTAACTRRFHGVNRVEAVTVMKGQGFIEPGDYTRTAFVGRCEEVRRLRHQDGDAITDWQQQHLVEQEQIRQGRRVQRRKAIEARLVERGWQPHHFDNDGWKRHYLVDTARDLSDKSWRSIRGKLEISLQAHEAERDAAHILVVQDRRRFEVEQEHGGLVVDGNLAKSLGLYPLPTWTEFGQLAVVQKLWHVATIDDAYDDEYPTIATEATSLAAELSGIKAAFKSRLVDHLVGFLSASEHVPDPIQMLLKPADPSGFTVEEEDKIVGLACCAIKCRTCQLVDVFPRILAHKCMSRFHGGDGAASWASTQYTTYESSVLALLSVLVAANLAPDAHYSQLDALGSTFTCLCVYGNAIAIPWQDMAWHIDVLHSGSRELYREVVAESRQEALERVFETHEKSSRWAGMRGDDGE
ncbi:hypothetical protein JCM8208_000365 [Rhodotorula glutinis]